jgi:hypothetical protein
VAAAGVVLVAAHDTGAAQPQAAPQRSRAGADSQVMLCVTHRSYCPAVSDLPRGSPCSCIDPLEGNIPGRARSLDEILAQPDLLSGGPASRH